jgi:hypothetical protein
MIGASAVLCTGGPLAQNVDWRSLGSCPGLSLDLQSGLVTLSSQHGHLTSCRFKMGMGLISNFGPMPSPPARLRQGGA